MTGEADYASTVAAWREHLRAGGSTPWRVFPPTSGVAADGPPASAVHLELVRRLDSSLPSFSGLADLVLSTPAPGRGQVDVPLPWPTPAAYGAPAADPEHLPADELLRLAASVIAALVLAVPPVPSSGSVRSRWWARRFRVSGAPVMREQVRSALLARGWQESRRGGTHIVIGAPVLDGFAQVWADRVSRGGAVSWARLWERQRIRDELPPALRHAELLDRARRTGGRVLSLVGTADAVRTELRDRLGVETPGAVDLVAVDLTRRVNAVLHSRLTHERASLVRPRLTAMVGNSPNPVIELDVPAAERDWAAGLTGPDGAGYAPSQVNAPDRVPAERTLALALAAIGRAWEEKVSS